MKGTQIHNVIPYIFQKFSEKIILHFVVEQNTFCKEMLGALKSQLQLLLSRKCSNGLQPLQNY